MGKKVKQDRRSKPQAGISIVITDLDNTLFDWVDIWYRSFKAMLDRLVSDSGVPAEQLETEFKEVFQKHGTAEYAFAIEELPSLRKSHPEETLVKKYEQAITEYRLARKNAICLYPDVRETLETLKDMGCLLVGYTESMAFYTNYRMRALGLDRILDYLYSPPDHDLPSGLSAAKIRHYSSEHYEFRRTIHLHTPKGEKKPSPRVLLDIIRDVGGVPQEAVYIGDSLFKDIVMAKRARVTDVWAKYGVAQDRPAYQLLRKVTHWSPDEVQQENSVTEKDAGPSYVLGKSIGELLGLFQFTRYVDRSTEHLDRLRNMNIHSRSLDYPGADLVGIDLTRDLKAQQGG
jgi:phosphoglycolate phosphatase